MEETRVTRECSASKRVLHSRW